MQVVTLNANSISIGDDTTRRVASITLSCIENDCIVDEDLLQQSIIFLIESYEQTANKVIKEVSIVCNVLGLRIVRTPLSQKIEDITVKYPGSSLTNFVEMKACKVCEFYKQNDLKILIKVFASVCVEVRKIFSPIILFLKNATDLLNTRSVNILHIDEFNIILCTTDGAGSVSTVKSTPMGIGEMLKYIASSAEEKFPYLKNHPEVIPIILQHFVHLNEFEMIEKIQSIDLNKRVLSFIN